MRKRLRIGAFSLLDPFFRYICLFVCLSAGHLLAFSWCHLKYPKVDPELPSTSPAMVPVTSVPILMAHIGEVHSVSEFVRNFMVVN